MTDTHHDNHILEMSGLVAKPERYTSQQLRVMGQPAENSDRAIVPLKPLLEEARPDRKATHVTAASADGTYTASIPLHEALSKGELHVDAPDGDPSPLRLLVPGGMTLCWNVKGLGRLKVTEGPEPDSLPEVLTH